MNLKRWFLGSSPEEVSFSREFMSSVVVFLVALPLCMGIAIASGAPPALGLVTGIVGGLIVGFVSGSPLQVSGPAAGLAVIVYELIQQHGLVALGVIVFLAGMLQLVAGLMKFGRWFRAVSPAVIHGMLAGIGVLIFGSQFHIMVDDKPRSSGLANLLSIPEAVMKGLFPMDGSSHHLAALVGVVTILTIVFWRIFQPKSLSFLPAPLLAIIAASALAGFYAMKIQFISVPENLLKSLNMPFHGKALGFWVNPKIWMAAIGMAVVASAESLLCATATDQMHDGDRTNYDQELTAQGIGNIVCGVFGALPLTGVIVRSTANIESGAKTRISAILHGVWLLAFVVALPFVIQLVPRAALAAILVFIGYKLVDVTKMQNLWKASRTEFGIYLATVVSIVSIDLLSGVMIGVGLSLLKLLYTFSHMEIKVEESKEVGVEGRTRYDVYVEGGATFLRLPEVAATLEGLPRNSEIHLHLGGLAYIDHACIELLDSWNKQIDNAGGLVVVEWDLLTERFRKRPVLAVNEGQEKPPADLEEAATAKP